MPDYTYLRGKIQKDKQEKADCENKKHIEFVNTFLSHRNALIELLVKDCKRTVEKRVTDIYTMGIYVALSKYSYNKNSPCKGLRTNNPWGGLKKIGLFHTNYKLYNPICHTWHGYTAITAYICSYLNLNISSINDLEEGIIWKRTNYDGDEFFCEWYFPTEQHLDEFIHDVNTILIADEIEVYKYYGREEIYLCLKENLGSL